MSSADVVVLITGSTATGPVSGHRPNLPARGETIRAGSLTTIHGGTDANQTAAVARLRSVLVGAAVAGTAGRTAVDHTAGRTAGAGDGTPTRDEFDPLLEKGPVA